MFSINVWKTRHYMSDHGSQLTANSKSLIQPQRRTDQLSWVGNAAQEVGDDWQSIVAVYWRCPRLTWHNQSSTARLCVADTDALLCRACTAHVLERPASASWRAADATDHDRICGYHWLGVQQHSALVKVCLLQTSAPRLVQSYSNRG